MHRGHSRKDSILQRSSPSPQSREAPPPHLQEVFWGDQLCVEGWTKRTQASSKAGDLAGAFPTGCQDPGPEHGDREAWPWRTTV